MRLLAKRTNAPEVMGLTLPDVLGEDSRASYYLMLKVLATRTPHA